MIHDAVMGALKTQVPIPPRSAPSEPLEPRPVDGTDQAHHSPLDLRKEGEVRHPAGTERRRERPAGKTGYDSRGRGTKGPSGGDPLPQESEPVDLLV